MTFDDIDADLDRIAQRAFQCPRCPDGIIPTPEKAGQYPGALSRADNMTFVCSACGFDEAMRQFFRGETIAVNDWPVEREFEQPIPEAGLEALRRLNFPPDGSAPDGETPLLP